MVSTPHDALFRATFSDLARAAEEIRHVFAPEVVARMDLSTLALEPGSVVDTRLRQCHADMLYSLQFSGHRALVYVLLEHESSHDPWLPLWLLIYIARIWESLLQRDKLAAGRLPAILPAVVHHGEKGWQASTRFEALLDLPDDTPEAVWAHVPRFRFALDDLTATSSEALRRRTVSIGTRLVLAALKEVRTIPDPALLVRGLAELIRGARGEPGAIRRIIQYIGAVRAADEHGAIVDILATEVGPEEATFMETILERSERIGLERGRQEGERKGRQEGERKGRQEGERKILVRQLRRRFGDLPAAVLAQIDAADEATLERWSEELLDAPSLSALFPSS